MTHARTTSFLRAGAACALAGTFLLGSTGYQCAHAAPQRLPHGASAASQAASGVALAKIVLSLRDTTAAFGGGFTKQSDTNLVTNLFGSRINAKVGRISGYTTGYLRQQPSPVMLNSGVNLFKNSKFASTAVRRVYAVYSSPQNQKVGVHVQRLEGLGDAALTLSYDLGTRKGIHLRELCVMFSQGPYAADIILVTGGKLDRAKLMTLAGTMDSRIKNA